MIFKNGSKKNETILNLIKTTNRKLNLEPPLFLTSQDSLTTDYLLLKNGIIVFEGKIISINNKNTNLPKKLLPHLIINPNQFNHLESNVSEKVQIITNKRFIPKKYSIFKTVHQTSKQGAFMEKW